MDFFQAAVGIVLIGCSTGIVCTAIDAIQKVKTKGRDQELKLANERMRLQELQLIEMRRQSEALQRQLEWHDKLLAAQARAEQLPGSADAGTARERISATR